MYSSGAVSWTSATATEANEWWCVAFGNNLFVVVANTGTNRVMYSSDAQSWTSATGVEANGWFGVTFGNNLFVAVAYSGTNRVMYSNTPTNAPTYTPTSALTNAPTYTPTNAPTNAPTISTVSEVDTSSSITTGWIVLLTLVCTIAMLCVAGALVWKVRAQRQRERLSANVESTLEQPI
jgi:hypothetical protein